VINARSMRHAGLGVLFVLGAAWGCGRPTAAAGDHAPSISVPPASAALAPGTAVVDDPNYSATLLLAGPCRHAQPCTLHAEIVAKGEYHINDQYPYKWKASEAPGQGVTYPKPLVGREDGTFEHMRAVLRVPFVAAAPGPVKVGGVLSLSVCSAANCLMYKQALELTVKVE
jgi:hypothetical protein